MALIGHQKRRLVRDTIASIEKYWGWYLFIFLAAAVLITYWEMQQVPSIACSTGCAVNSLTDAEQQRHGFGVGVGDGHLQRWCVELLERCNAQSAIRTRSDRLIVLLLPFGPGLSGAFSWAFV